MAHWNIDEPVRPFGTLLEMNREVHEFRINHDFSPGTAIEEMAAVLRGVVDRPDFERALGRLPEGAQEFWKPSEA